MSGIVLRRGHSFKKKDIFTPKELALYNIHNNTTGMKDSELIRRRHLLEEQMEAESKKQAAAAAAAAALAQTRKRTSKVGALISATVSRIFTKKDMNYLSPNKLPTTPRTSPTEGGYNSRKYKKPTILPKKPKRATILSKKLKKPTVLTKKPKKVKAKK